MFNKLKRKIFGAVYNGPEPAEQSSADPAKEPHIPPYPVNGNSASDDSSAMSFVYAGPDPFVRVDGPAYPENQTMGIMAPEEPALPVYAGPPVFSGEDPYNQKYIPPTMGLPAPPPPYKGYIRLDHPNYQLQREFGVRSLTIGRMLMDFPIPQEFQPTISREHCSISYQCGSDYFIVKDHNSTNGVLSRDMIWQVDNVFAIGGQAFDWVEKTFYGNRSCHWQQFGHRLPAEKEVVVSPGTSLRIGTMDVVLWSEKNPESWG